MAFYEIDPWGSWRDNYNVARLCALYAAVHSRKDAEIHLGDYIYKDPDISHEENQRAIANTLISLARAAEGEQ